MPVPKRKTSKSRRDKRHANKGIDVKNVPTCSHCGDAVQQHAACSACGYYRGKKVMATKNDRLEKRVVDRTEKAEKLKARSKSAEEASGSKE
ncbi:MAG: 50S ribosomal protein L32 [candidate division TM6 bacterium GW2011_GWF2_32_72]|nr:MAG: 50S ribosomal protein L32 [candidate division TM6 bacterium GW2011_GWF2_32_72]